MDVRRRVGANLQRLRRAQGWSQEELADRAGLHRTYVSQIERALKNVTIVNLEKIAVVLGVTIGALADEDPHRIGEPTAPRPRTRRSPR